MKKKILFLAIFLLAIFLRFYQLGKNPVSMYWDEVAIALDAYSFNETGRDMNNMNWLQPVFGSYGDFKAPVFILLVIPFVKVFGMSALAVRLAIAIFSVFSLILVYFLSKEVLSFDKKLAKKYEPLPLITLLVVGISPWPVHFARIGLESSLSVFFFLAALLFFFKGIKGKGIWILISIIPAVLAVYSYYSLRVIIPLLVFSLILIFHKKIWTKKLWSTVLAIILFLLSIVPIFKSPYYLRSQDYRLNNNNLIYPNQLIKESSQYLESYNSNLYSRVVYHRYIFWLRDFLKNMTSHYSLDFLFISGDANLRQHSGYFGEFFLIFLPFYLLGLFLLFKNIRSKISQFLLTFLLLAPIPAAMVYEVPHASRAIYLFVPFSIIIAWGLNEFWFFLSDLKNKNLSKLIKFGFISALILNTVLYYSDYFIDYPKRSSDVWLYQYNQVAIYIKNHHQEYREIKIDDRYWFPDLFIYYQFPELIPQIQKLKNALLNDPINSFGMPDPFVYILDKGDESKKTAQFIFHDMEIPEGYYSVEEFNFLDGEKSLVLVVKDGLKEE